MPTLKTEILGSLIEINYEEEEKDKLIKIIEKFNDRLLDFKNLEGKVSDNKILFLAALKAEDEIFDFTNKSKSSLKEVEDIYKKQIEKINNLNQEIIELKDKINELNAISFCYGPGKFMGTRLSSSIIQGLSYPYRIPIISLSNLRIARNLSSSLSFLAISS